MINDNKVKARWRYEEMMPRRERDAKRINNDDEGDQEEESRRVLNRRRIHQGSGTTMEYTTQ